MRLWLDDVREMPDSFDVHVETVEDAILFLEEYDVVEVSLDHDLGYDKTGYDLACWIEKAATEGLPRLKWNIHSANPVGVAKMEAALQMADRYWRAVETSCKEHDSFPFVLNHFRSLPETMYWYTHKEELLGGLTPAQLILQDKHKALRKLVQEKFLEGHNED